MKTPNPRYFQGTKLGIVEASNATSFSEVVTILRKGRRLNITREQFFALSREEQNKRKHGPYFVPACFRDSPIRRTYDNATVCNLLFLDIDDSTDAARFVNDPNLLYAKLWKFNFAAYQTASSTPHRPRIRIVVDANAVPKALYGKAVKTIGSMLGLSKVTSESTVAVQPMYVPPLFKGASNDEGNAFC